MLLHIDLIFYWIHKRFQKTSCHHGQNPQNFLVNRPMFWSTPEKMQGHLVVIDSSAVEQIVHQYKNTIFVCVGSVEKLMKNTSNEYIVIEDEIPIMRVFNKLLEIFDLLQDWEAALDKALNQFLSFDAIIRSCDLLLEDPIALVDAPIPLCKLLQAAGL